MKANRFTIVVICVVILGTMLVALLRNSGKEENFTIGGIGYTGTSALFFTYGEEKGIFHDHGLNVTYVPFRDIYTMMLAFFSGKIDTVVISPGLAAKSYNDGEKLKIAIALAKSPEHLLLGQPGITGLTDLKGKKLGIHGKTSDQYNILKWYLESKGMDIEDDIQLVKIRSPANLLTSFKTGQLDAVFLWGRYAVEAKSSGGTPILRLDDMVQELMGHPYYLPVMMIRDDFLAQKENTAKRFLSAMREAAKSINTNQDDAAEILARFSKEPVEIVKEVNGMAIYVGDLDNDIQQEIMMFFDYGAQKDYFGESPGKEIFYDDWR